MFSSIDNQSGFVKLILIIVIAIIALSYFGFDLRSIVEAPRTQDNLHYVWDKVTFVWYTYFDSLFNYLWNDIFMDLLWDSFINNLERIKGGQPTTIEQLAPETIPIQ